MRLIAIVILLAFSAIFGTQWLGRWIGEGQIERQSKAMDDWNLKRIEETKDEIAKDPVRMEQMRQHMENMEKMKIRPLHSSASSK